MWIALHLERLIFSCGRHRGVLLSIHTLDRNLSEASLGSVRVGWDGT
jgi:hypothetical protein